jgi:C1A family cysteine protease
MQPTILKDLIDDRDYIFSSNTQIVNSFSLKDYVEVIEDQRQTHSCTAHAGTSAFEIHLKMQNNFFQTSRLFLYYWLRNGNSNLEGKDNGAYTRDVCKCLYTYGICPEDHWKFDLNNIETQPPQSVIDEAKKNRVLKYERIIEQKDNTLKSIKQAICEKKPIIIGMNIDDRFFSAGVQSVFEEQVKAFKSTPRGEDKGGHTMVIVGYDGDNLIIENSWSSQWGNNGFICLPYEDISGDILDLWVMSEIDTNLQNDVKQITLLDKIKIFFKNLFRRK